MKKQFLIMMLLAVLGLSQQLLACQATFTWTADTSGGVQFSNTSTGLSGAGNVQWTFGDGTSSTQLNPYHQYNSSSWFMVCLTIWDSAGCQSTYCDTIATGVSGGGCHAYFTFSTNGAANNTVSFFNQSTGVFTGFQFDYGDGTTGSTLQHTYQSPGNYTVCLNIGTNPGSSCSDQYCSVVSVQGSAVNCDAQFTYTDTTGGTLFIPDVLNAPVIYSWNFGDGHISTDPVPFHTYNANGYYNVCLTITDTIQNCTTTWCDTIGVGMSSSCNANFGYQNSAGSTHFYSFGNGTPGSAFTSWHWTFGDGTSGTGQNPVHTYQQSGTYIVCLYASGFQCADTVCQTISVNTGTGSGCNAGFSGFDSSGVYYFVPDVYNTQVNYHWTFGDGTTSTQPYPVHVYNSNGYFNVCLTATDSLQNCTSVWCDSVYSGNGTTTGCSAHFSYQSGSASTYFYGYNGNPGTTFNSWFWDFGDGTTATGQNPIHAYQHSGTYTVCLYATNVNCTDTVCQQVIVNGGTTTGCNAMFSVNDSAGIHYFIPNVVSGLVNYHWNFGDGSTSTAAIPSHVYNANGLYTVCLTVTDSIHNCTTIWCDSVYAGGGNPTICTVDFTFQGGSVSTFFSGFGTGTPASTFTNWYWDFGDGTTGTGQTPLHQYMLNGTYNVCLYASNFSCTATVCKLITVISGTGPGCDATFTAHDSGGVKIFIPNFNSNAVNYHWDFGDNTTSTQITPSHTYSGTGPYIVCLTVTDSIQGCTATHCDTVYVSSNPINCQAYFSYVADSTFNVHFINASVGNYAHVQWSFGDGTSSTLPNPTHIYNGTGPYIVCLTIFGNTPANSCQSTFCDTVYPGQNANSCVPVFYTYPDSTVFGNGNMNFVLLNTCANTTYVWDFGDGTTLTTTGSTPPPVHQYPATGWYTVCVTATTPANVYNYCNQVYAFRLSSGIGNTEKLDALVYPNPASNIAILRFNAAGETVVNMYSIDGRLALTQNAGFLNGNVQLPLQITPLENGVYFVQLHSGDLSGTVRILVQH